jgi:hypothetical protein
MQSIPESMILRVLAQADCTGKVNFSTTLQELVRCYDVVDAWAVKQTRDVYTHYTQQSTTRIDRIYVTLNISGGVETVKIAITDHLAVVLRMVWEGPLIHQVRGYWKINVAFLKEKSLPEK